MSGPETVERARPAARRAAPTVVAPSLFDAMAPGPADLGPSLGPVRDVGAAAGPERQVHDAEAFAPPAARSPVFLPLREGSVGFDATRPWIVTAARGVSAENVSLDLYGIDISGAEAGPAGQPVIQNLLQPHQQTAFRAQMEARLDADLTATQELLLASDQGGKSRTLLATLRYWAQARDYTDAAGTSYFDRFLDRLDAGRIVVTHSRYVPLIPGAEWETGRSEKSYLDDLYEEAGGRIGEVLGVVAANSVKHGGYRPGWHQFQRIAAGQEPDLSGAPEALMDRAVETLLDQLPGATSTEQSRIVRDILVGLPPRDKARLLNRVMERHDETSYGLGRFGEPTPQHMLHYVMENLDESHREDVFGSLEEAGIFDARTVRALRAGRTLAGQYLPYTTHLGAEAAQWYADEYVQTGNEIYLVGGAFASLWTPETATATATTLITAGMGPAVAQAPMWMQKGLLVVGTGTASYELTQSVIELSTGQDMTTGERLSQTEMWVRGILAVSNAIMLGAGFAGAHQLGRPGPAAGAPEVLPAGRAGAPRLTAGPETGMARAVPQRGGARIIGMDEAGNVRVVAQDPVTGEMAYLRINQHTGDGFAVIPGRGTVQIRAGQPVPERAALPAGEAAPLAAPEVLGGAAAPEVIVLPRGGARPPRLLTGDRPRRALPAGDEDFSTIDVFGPEAAGRAWVVTPEGVVVPELPPVAADVPVYLGDLSAARVPRLNLGPRQVAVGPEYEGLTWHELFLGRQPGVTSQSLGQMRRAPSGAARPGQARGDQLEIFVEEAAGPLSQRHGGGIRAPVSGEMRFPDVRQPVFGQTIAYEGKNYLRWMSPSGGGAPQLREVPYNATMRQQIANDAYIMYYGEGNFRPVWVFGNAPPSAALADALRQAGIPYIQYGDRLVP